VNATAAERANRFNFMGADISLYRSGVPEQSFTMSGRGENRLARR
jgi:hypothetical protein